MQPKHDTYRTEETYGQWMRRYLLIYNKRHPQERGKAAIVASLTHLAIQR